MVGGGESRGGEIVDESVSDANIDRFDRRVKLISDILIHIAISVVALNTLIMVLILIVIVVLTAI